MGRQGTVVGRIRGGSSGKWLRFTLLALVVIAIALMAASVSADGAVQVSGVGYWPGEEECLEPSNGQEFDYSYLITGDLEGCVYAVVETARCTPSGVYIETGTEFWDVVGGTQGAGTFLVNYRFQGKYTDCNLEVELFGGCQHPIVLNTGTEDFEGVTGRFDFRDDVDAGNFPYRGHLRW